METITKKHELLALTVAQSNGYDAIKRYGLWFGMDVYVAQMDEWSDELNPCIGYPDFIIVDRLNIARMASSDETLEILSLNNASKVRLVFSKNNI